MRTLTLGLSAIAIIILFSSGAPAPQPTPIPDGVQVLTQKDMECIVGGQAPCTEVASESYHYCMSRSGVSPLDPEAYASASLECTVDAGWSFLICGIQWLWSLIF